VIFVNETQTTKTPCGHDHEGVLEDTVTGERECTTCGHEWVAK
jgi:hypothetical protein